MATKGTPGFVAAAYVENLTFEAEFDTQCATQIFETLWKTRGQPRRLTAIE
jgi:hypothetical protein